jgi:hypothetical protein
MLLLCIGIGKVAYRIGFSDGNSQQQRNEVPASKTYTVK